MRLTSNGSTKTAKTRIKMVTAGAKYRPRRMRERDVTRRLLRETHLTRDQLVMPLFVREGRQVRAPIPSLPGQFQFSIDQLVRECQELAAVGVPAVLLFGIPAGKDDRGSGAYAKNGIVQRAVRALKEQIPKLLVITDVCLCAYTSHGHCGVVTTRGMGQGRAPSRPAFRGRRDGGRSRAGGRRESHSDKQAPVGEGDFWIDNEASLELLTRVAVSHAEAGADLVAPSDMMDGNVGAIRLALDDTGFHRMPIMAYSVKFASSFYGPFRQAVDSAPAFGDRRSYQMDPANGAEALREAALDIEQGADIIMVKPALAYLDVIQRIKQELRHPVAAFNVSGEYAMVKAAASRGWMAERATWMEILLSLKRAGADVVITYWAKEAAKLVRDR